MTPFVELAAGWIEHADIIISVVSIVAVPTLLASLLIVARGALSSPRERVLVITAFVGVTMAKVLLWPPQNLILVDEWASLSAVRELAAGRAFLNCRADIPGVTRECIPLVYVPLFHVWAAAIVRIAEIPPRSAGALLNALATSAVLPLVWVTVRRLRTDLPTGVVATVSLLAASLPAILTYSRTSTTDPLFVAFTLAGAAALAGAATDPLRYRLHTAGLGAAFVLGSYARPEGFALGLVWAAGTAAAFAIVSRRLPRVGASDAAVASIAIVVALPAHLYGIANNVESPGSLAWLGSLVGFGLSFLVPLLAPHVFPVWLSVGTLRSARPVSERHRALGLALLFAFVSTALVYSISFADFEPPMPERTFAMQRYHLGVPSLLALAVIVAALPIGGRVRRARTIAAVCVLLNVAGTVALTAAHMRSTKVSKAAEYSRIADELEPNAVVFAFFSPMVRALSGHDHAAFDAMPHIDWQRLGDRPVYAFDSAPESNGREASSRLTEAATASGVVLEPTVHPLLWRVRPPPVGTHPGVAE